MKASAIVADGTFSCMTAPLQGDYEKIFMKQRKLGMTRVQLTLNRPEEVDAERIFALAEKNRLKISAIATGMGYTVDGLSLGHGDEKIRTAAVKRMCDHVDLAEKLGGAMVIIGAIRGRYADAPSEVIYYQQFHKSMEELIPYAEKKRIVIIFEANDHLETDAYISIKDTAEYIRECGSPCSVCSWIPCICCMSMRNAISRYWTAQTFLHRWIFPDGTEPARRMENFHMIRY